jgi:hypothetical protein
MSLRVSELFLHMFAHTKLAPGIETTNDRKNPAQKAQLAQTGEILMIA